MDLGLRHRVFIVTGSTRGLGRAAATRLVAEGARVVISGRDEETVARASREIGEDNTIAVAADNAEPEAAQRLVRAALARWGRLDGALISVGGPAAGSTIDTSDDAWRAGFESIFLGAVRLARTVATSCHTDGSIAFVLSSSVRSPVPGLAVSNGLRPGLAMVAKTMADELGPKGTRINGLLPGRIDTARARELDALSGDADKARAAQEDSIPLRRYGAPEEFGRVAAFILSPAASYITGTMIPVDGGAIRAL